MKNIIYLTIVMIWFLFSLFWFIKGLKAKYYSDLAIFGTTLGFVGMVFTTIIMCGIIEELF